MLLRPPADESRLEANLTPMIDMVFQLLIFFLCATRFRMLEGKLDSYLPRTGSHATSPREIPPEEIRIELRHDLGATKMRVGEREVVTDEDLERAVAGPAREFRRIGMRVDVVIDAAADVPTSDVVKVLNGCVKGGVLDVRFAQPERWD